MKTIRDFFRPLEPGSSVSIQSLDELPVSGCPVYLMKGAGGICLSGTATVQVFGHCFRIVRGMVLALFPRQLASIKEVSDDFPGSGFFRISHDMFTDTLSSPVETEARFLFAHACRLGAREEYVGRFLNFCDLLATRRKMLPPSAGDAAFAGVLLGTSTPSISMIRRPRRQPIPTREELAFRFMQTIVEEHSSPNRTWRISAEARDHLKYLTNLMNEISGAVGTGDWIVYYTIFEIKALLRESAMDLKTIVARVNFPRPVDLEPFFRRYTGMSPSQYRKNIHF